MPGTIKIWWHDGAVKDARYNDLPVANEPELGFEMVTTDGATPVASGPAPVDTSVAIIETDVNLRYLVRPPGDGGSASQLTSKPMPATGLGTDSIGIPSGHTISFVEV